MSPHATHTRLLHMKKLLHLPLRYFSQLGPIRRWLMATGALAFLFLSLGLRANEDFKSEQGVQQQKSVEVTLGDVTDTVVASGILQAEDMVSLGTQVSGRVERLHVKLGEKVKAGQLIAEIDAESQATAVEVAKQQLEAARAQRRSTQVELNRNALLLQRQRELLAGQGTSQEAVEVAEAEHAASQAALDMAEARVQELKSSLNAASLALGQTHVRSPIDGEVVAVMVREGQVLNANFAAPHLVKVARLSRMQIRVNLSELDIPRVSAGQTVLFATMGEPNTWRSAQLELIEPLPVDQQHDSSGQAGAPVSDPAAAGAGAGAVYFGAVLTADNAQGDLRVGMTVMVRVVVASAKSASRLPRSAVDELIDLKASRNLPRQVNMRVITANGHIESRSVQLGLRDEDHVQVVSGLRAGERVLLPGTKKPA